MMRFSVNFWTSFWTSPSGCFVIPLMFFDALMVPGRSHSDPGSIWETSFFHENSQKNCPKNWIYALAFRHAHSIDLRFETYIPHYNDILQIKKTMGLQTIFAIFRNQCKWTQNYPKRLSFLPIWLAPLWPRFTLKEHRYMLYESLKVLSSRPAAGNTCVSMRKMRKMSPKTHQNDGFQV